MSRGLVLYAVSTASSGTLRKSTCFWGMPVVLWVPRASRALSLSLLPIVNTIFPGSSCIRAVSSFVRV